LSSTITASPAALAVTVMQGQSATVTVSLQKGSTDSHVWEPKTSVPWIWLSPPYGSSNSIATEIDSVQVTVRADTLPVGTTSALVYILETAPGIATTLSVPVSVTVTASNTTSGTAPSPPPPPPIGNITPPPPPPPAPSVGTVTISWTPNSEADLAGYKVNIGTASGTYTQVLDVGNVTSYSIMLPKGVTYFFAVSAYDTSGNESVKSAEMSKSIF
jgi:hypothetical protein